MSDKASAGGARNVLFLCTGNSARSILAEAIMNRIGPPGFQACSAGSHPKGKVHLETLRLLNALGYDTSGLRSKSWETFTDGPASHLVITVCNNAAGEVCPAIPGKPARMHWDIPDPTSVNGTKPQIEAAFRQAYDTLLERVRTFISQ
jgi:arsenate reductase